MMKKSIKEIETKTKRITRHRLAMCQQQLELQQRQLALS
jgi:hypothetical protein